MTLKNVAVISGCSVSTVSKVFSNSAEISEETKQKVLKAASETGYFEKAAKHKPVLGAIKSIVLLSKTAGEPFAELFISLSKMAKGMGFFLLFAIGDEKDASLMIDQMGASGAIILTDKKKQDQKTIKFLPTDPPKDSITEALSSLISEIESIKPVRVRAKKSGSTETAKPVIQTVSEESKSQETLKAKKDEIWLL